MAILRKLKGKIKKAAAIKKVKKAVMATKKAPRKKTQKVILGSHETVVEKAKFSHPENQGSVQRAIMYELPYLYDQDKIVLQVRDPRWLHAYWEVRGATFERLKNELKENFFRAKRVVRVYDVADTNFDGTNANSFFDVAVNDFANNWYIDTNAPGRSWCVDYGLILPDGRFIMIIRSNIVHAPLEGPSWITDEEWMIPEDLFASLYGMGFGFGSSPVKAVREMFKQAVSSPGISSGASPVKKAGLAKKFWLTVNCELIVYGATEPDAKVTVQGKPITLRQDGTFTLRFALPDGKQAVPVKAKSQDNTQERSITPIVNRETK